MSKKVSHKKNNRAIKFKGQILDNVHGFISYTEAEEQIMALQLFKRLQSIKQLSVVNWVFPGSEHTRFIHSLGVMHVADKMAIALGLKNHERRILRLAGLLHDIGHYPQSHVCELPYRNCVAMEDLSDDQFCRKENEKVLDRINDFRIKRKTDLMAASSGAHHEAIGANIVRTHPEIRKIIIQECKDERSPDIIADIIIGCIDHPYVDPLLVQIIHSELDADGIDYMMRDSAFSGTSFGSCEIDQLIRCLVVGEQDGKRILCIHPKGIAAADQYLINKFFHYSQVVCNRHITISEWMAERVTSWMRQNGTVFPNEKTLENWAKRDHASLLNFTDNLFWSALEQIVSDKFPIEAPHYIQVFCKCLLRHDEPQFIRDSEVRFITRSTAEARRLLKGSPIIKQKKQLDKQITIFETRSMSKQLPLKLFRMELAKSGIDAETDENTLDPELARLMECVSVKEDDGSIRLLCDHPRSLMRSLYNQTLVIMRTYKFPEDRNLERTL